MAHEASVQMATSLQSQLAGLVEAADNALKDSSLGAVEGVTLAVRGATLAGAVVGFIKRATPEERQDLVFVLQHARLVLES